MTGFEFRNYTLTLTLVGKEYPVTVNSAKADVAADYGRKLQELADQVYNKEKTAEDAISVCTEFINMVLEDDKAFDKIFAGRTPNITDCHDLMLYITDEMMKFSKKMLMNRTTGLGAAKKKR